MEKFLWRFYWDCGRQGDVEGLFVATADQVRNLYGKHANFGEILGKHSEVFGDIDEKDIEKLNVSSSAVEEVSKVLGKTWSGYNPTNYVDGRWGEDDEEGDENEEWH